MNKLFKFFNKKVILSSVAEAEKFINSLTDMNIVGGRKLVVNDNLHRHLVRIFKNDDDGMKLQTIGCSNTCFIYCYPTFGFNTIEECEHAWLEKEMKNKEIEKEKVIKEHQRISSELSKRREMLSTLPIGWYEVNISMGLLNYYTICVNDKCYQFRGIAKNGEEAYKKVIEQIKKQYKERLVWYDNILKAEVIFLGMKTDTGFSNLTE